MVTRVSVPALEPVVVSFGTASGSSNLLALVGALQHLASGSIKISVCSYGSGDVWLELVPKAESLYKVIDLVVDQFVYSDEYEGRELREGLCGDRLSTAYTIIETAEAMLPKPKTLGELIKDKLEV